MFAMPGLRSYSLAEDRGRGVSCSADGVFVGSVALLQPSPFGVGHRWSVRETAYLNSQLSALYQLPIDVGAKTNALALIAEALNRGDFALAAIATVQMRWPDPPTVAKGAETPDELRTRAEQLFRSGLLKFWDPAKHPRAGVPPNPGWFAPNGEATEGATVVPAAMVPRKWPWDKDLVEGGGGGAPRGTLELPFPEWPRLPWSGEAKPAAPRETPKNWTPPDPNSKLPFMSETQPQLAPRDTEGKTSGIFKGGDLTVELQSGYDGPAANLPEKSPGFDGYTRTHVEGHAAAFMRQMGITEGTLNINNSDICRRCMKNLPTMLPSGSTLHVVLPDGSLIDFQGIGP